MRPLHGAVAIFLGACAPPDTSLVDVVTGPVAAPSTCPDQRIEVFPADGESGVLYLNGVRIQTELPEDEVDARLTDPKGQTVPASVTSSEDKRTWFLDHEGLQPETTYALSFETCAGPVRTSFTTSDVGTPLGGLDHLVGMTWVIDEGIGQITEPASLDPLIRSALGAMQPMFQLRRQGEGKLRLMFGAGVIEDGELIQDACAPTHWFPAPIVFEADPLFVLAAEHFEAVAGDIQVSLDSLAISGALSPDGSSVLGLQVDGFLDTRPISAWAYPDDPPTTLCNTLDFWEVSCERCADGVPACVQISMEGGQATEVPVWLDQVSADAVALDPTCEDEPQSFGG